MVVPVGDVDIAVLVEGDPPRLVELAVAFAGPAALSDEFAVRREDLQPIVAAVDDDDVAVFLYGQAGRAKQLTIAAAGLAPLAQEFAAGVNHGDRVSPVVLQVDLIPVVVDGYSERPSAMTVAVAVLAKVGEPFFFTGRTQLGFIDVHPEIILVAPIGGIENAIFPKAHRLNIIEARATGCVAPDGMAPIENASFRHCCERHSAPPLWIDVLRLLTLYCQLPLLPEVLASGRRQLTALPSVQEGWLLKGAIDDRRRIELQPLVEDRRVDAAEVHVRVEVALNQMLGLQRRHFTVMATLDLLAEHKGDAAGAMIGSRAVVANATAELGEQQHDHIVGVVVLAKVLHEGVDALGHRGPQ